MTSKFYNPARTDRIGLNQTIKFQGESGINGKKAIVILANLLDRDTRATKVIKTLSNNGYKATLLCWNRGFRVSKSEHQEGGDFHREIQLKFKAPWGSMILFFLPIWWSFIFFWLMATKWDIVHAIQIISLPPAVIAGRIKGKPIIYDMLDTYEDTVLLPRTIRNICVKIDKLFMWLANGVILADEAQIEEVAGIPNSKVVVIYDSPDTISKINHSTQKNEIFTLFFAGLLFSGKALNLDKIFSAIESIECVKIVIAGYGDLVKEIKDWSYKLPDKIEFIGEIDHADVLEKSIEANLLFILRDSIIPVNKYICGSKVLEAMMCGKPILVNKGTSTANIVNKENCGLVVDAHNIEELKTAIINLRDNPGLCHELGANARKAYDEIYSWKIMERKLLALYQELTEEITIKDEEV
ncbi:MAG: glycosyltransferase [ANME-2 cluster archaeon]|nr:MAG: glycosyltransferase [ANME-2 cluster archaeon]